MQQIEIATIIEIAKCTFIIACTIISGTIVTKLPKPLMLIPLKILILV